MIFQYIVQEASQIGAGHEFTGALFTFHKCAVKVNYKEQWTKNIYFARLRNGL